VREGKKVEFDEVLTVVGPDLYSSAGAVSYDPRLSRASSRRAGSSTFGSVAQKLIQLPRQGFDQDLSRVFLSLMFPAIATVTRRGRLQ
jgi:hypothetical protein